MYQQFVKKFGGGVIETLPVLNLEGCQPCLPLVRVEDPGIWKCCCMVPKEHQ